MGFLQALKAAESPLLFQNTAKSPDFSLEILIILLLFSLRIFKI